MKKPSKKLLKKLVYHCSSFPSLEWNEFLKNCNVNFYTSRKDRLWYSIKGNGYIIWISSSYHTKINNQTVWLIDLEILETAPKKGMDYLNEIIEGAVKAFQKMEVYGE